MPLRRTSTGAVPLRCDLPERDALIAVSQIVADFSGDPRAAVIYPGIDVSLFPATHSPHKGVVLGAACRLDLIKGLSYLFQALATLMPEFMSSPGNRRRRGLSVLRSKRRLASWGSPTMSPFWDGERTCRP